MNLTEVAPSYGTWVAEIITHWGNKAPSQLSCSNQLSYRQPGG
ncbi:hypothetical protein [Hymenobacter sp. BT188]|nr:hypothetical protein [Hymenobacter sp. BT188]